MFTNITMYAIMVFDEVLEADKLAASLEQLVQRETWQKLGARVRKGVCLPSLFFVELVLSDPLTSDRKTGLTYTSRESSLLPARLLPTHMSRTTWPK